MAPALRHSTSDMVLIVGCLIILTGGIIHMIFNRNSYISFKGNFTLIFVGLSLLVISSFGKCLDASRCDKELIKTFLSLITIENGAFDRHGIFFQLLATAAYGMIIVGIAQLSLVIINRIKDRKP